MIKETQINGIHYQIYYPNGSDNINPNTQVAIYMHGGTAHAAGANGAIGYLNGENNTDSIVIIPSIISGTSSSRNTEEFYNNVVNMYDDFISDNGINQNNLVISGFSSGRRSTFGILDSYLAKHQDSNPASVYLIDTYIQNGDSELQFNYDAYKENGTMFYAYSPGYNPAKGYVSDGYSSWGAFYTETADPLSKNGCNVINVIETSEIDHVLAEKVFFKDGIIDFSKGNMTLPSDKYTYRMRNPQTGLWEIVNVNDINTLEKLSSRFGITKLPMIIEDKYITNLNYLSTLSLSEGTISTDSDVLLGQIGNMYSVIKGSTFVKNSYSCSGTGSTTKVPSAIPEIVNKYFSSVSNILCSLGVFLKKCEESNELMEKTEEDIKKETEKLTTLTDKPSTPIYTPSPGSGGAPRSNPSPSSGGGPRSNPSPTPSNPGPTQEQPVQNDDSITETSLNWQEEFPEYDKLYSTNDKLVFNYNNEYLVIVHKEGETITGIEYYYDFGNSENANSALFKLSSMYENSNIENILVKDRYVKVIFDKSMFNNLSVSEFKNKYSNLNEVVRL